MVEAAVEECSITGAQDEVFVINDFERTLPPDGISVQRFCYFFRDDASISDSSMLQQSLA